jgi:hypothetical protein
LQSYLAQRSPAVSPTCFNQRVTVPSVMDSPIWGMSTSVMGLPLGDQLT